MKKRTTSFVWTLVALAVLSSGIRCMFQLKNWTPPSTQETFDEMPADAKVLTQHLVQRQDILKENTNSSSPSSKETETERPPSLRHPATTTSWMRKEQATAERSSMKTNVNVTSSGKRLEAPFSHVSKEEPAQVQPRTFFLQGPPWTRSPRSMTHVLEGSEMKGDVAYTTAATKKKSGRFEDCEVIWDWQKTFHPSCNEFHATSLVDASVDNELKMLGFGTFRQGLKVTHPHNDTQIVWKVSK
jgi:hypothetical protein